jgi:Tol biopolymer transport system component
MTEAAYAVLAWDRRTIQIGSLAADALSLHAVNFDVPLEDIRNCSSARDQPWGAVTGVNRQTRRQELWRFDLTGTGAKLLAASEYMLHNAIDVSGEYICYTAPPSRTRGDMSLYLYNLKTSRSDLIVPAAVSRYCIPSWRPLSGKIVYHTVDLQVVEVDINTKDVGPLFRGEHPAVSPDAIWIAYCERNEIRFWNIEDRRSNDIHAKQRFWEGRLQGGMSWSPDGKFLLACQSAGFLGYEIAFYRIEVQTGRRVRVHQRYLQGLRFR